MMTKTQQKFAERLFNGDNQGDAWTEATAFGAISASINCTEGFERKCWENVLKLWSELGFLEAEQAGVLADLARTVKGLQESFAAGYRVSADFLPGQTHRLQVCCEKIEATCAELNKMVAWLSQA